jgi:UDP-N-acetylglucosamine--N-acetylmuramyl-(pentapeptide) pyrophosphoryl-undecaprenol N-acetylglucosamine transferase
MPRKPEHMEADSGYRLVVGGGGTGGHLFPGVAVAQAFKSRQPGNQVLFVNAGRALEVDILSRLGWPQQSIAIEGIKGRSRWRQFKAVGKIPGAVWRAGRILHRYGADLVLGVGGYSAGPVVAAATLLGIPSVLHEQNRLPGVTNRILGHLVDRIYLTFDESREYFNAEKIKVSGNPVRDEILALASESIAPADGRSDAGFTVLVVGGSQGAQAINQAVTEALPLLKSARGIRFVHQTGERYAEDIRQAYDRAGIKARVEAFFDDMAQQYEQADMVVCRAGATTVAEITVAGKAAIFVPFPFAADDHQTQNALALANVGAAEMIRQEELNGPALAKIIQGYMENRILLTEMAAKARALGRPEAARDIVADMYRLLEGR